MSIRGIAGPTTVQAQNFAPGTTAADIESAMSPIGGKIVKCIVVATRPNVIAEIVFENRDGANCVIDTFHNQTVSTNALSGQGIPLMKGNYRPTDVSSTSSSSLMLSLPLKPPLPLSLLALPSQLARALTATTPGPHALQTQIAIISATVTAEMMLWMAHTDLRTIAWTRISMMSRNRCTAITWLAGGVTETITVTGREVTTGVVDVVEREAVDTDEGLSSYYRPDES